LSSLAAPISAPNLEAIHAALNEQPDGVLDDVAHRHGAPLRVVRDLLPGPAARSALGGRFAEIWGDLLEWGPVTFIVHTEDGVFEMKAPLPPGSEGRGYSTAMRTARLAGTYASRDARRSILSIGRSSAAGLARCSSSTSMAARCSRSLSGATKSGSCFPSNSPASSACATPKHRLDSEEHDVAGGARWAKHVWPMACSYERDSNDARHRTARGAHFARVPASSAR
jgi:Haem utilisation ChuX/HutX